MPGIVAKGTSSVGGWALKESGAALSLGRCVERRARVTASQELERAMLSVLAAALDTHLAGEVGRLVYTSRLAEHAMTGLLTGPLPTALDSPLAGEAGELVTASRFTERAVTSSLSGDLVDRVGEEGVRSAVVQRLSKQLLAEDAISQIVDRVMETSELWVLIDRIADSHPVAQVLERQSNQLAGVISNEIRRQARERTEARLDWMADHLLGRKGAKSHPTGGTKQTATVAALRETRLSVRADRAFTRVLVAGRVSVTHEPFRRTPVPSTRGADRLGVGRPTVKTHVDKIYKQLGVTTRAQAVERAEAGGFLQDALAVREPH